MEIFWLGLSLLLGLAANLLGIPVLAGYLTAGFTLAFFGIESNVDLERIADLGFSVLLFTIGLHFRVNSFFRPEVFGPGIIHLILFSLASFLLLGFLYEPSFPLAIALAFSSTVATAKVLEERDELDSFHGRVAIGILVLQDIAAVLVIAYFGSYGFSEKSYALFSLIILIPLLRSLLTKIENQELTLLLGITSALGFAELFRYSGLSPYLGAILGGASLAGLPKSDDLYEKLWGIKEILLLGIFLDIGLYGIPKLAHLPMILVFLALLPLKAFLFFVLFASFKLRARTAFMSALSLTAYSEFCLVITGYMARQDIITREFVSAAALLTALSFIVKSIVMKNSSVIWNSLGDRLIGFQSKAKLVDRQPTSFGSADTLIIGMGSAGNAAYARLLELGKRPVGIDNDPARLESGLKAERRIVLADAQDRSFWNNADLDKIESILLAVPSFEAKQRALEELKRVEYPGTIAALSRSESSAKALSDLGVRTVCVPMVEAGRELADIASRANE